MKNKRLPCRSCDLLAAQIEETNGDCYRQYNQVLQKLMELEHQGEMELFAGDCPLEDTYTMLEAEQHYTICHYMRCRSCGTFHFIGACIRGMPVVRQMDDIQEEKLDTRLWGRYGTYFSRKKD